MGLTLPILFPISYSGIGYPRMISVERAASLWQLWSKHRILDEGWLGPLLCVGFAGTIVTCLWLLWVFLTVKDTPVGAGSIFPGARGMVIFSSPPLAFLGFVVGAVIGVILCAIVRALRLTPAELSGMCERRMPKEEELDDPSCTGQIN
jgi:hypothetical protein